MATIYILLSRSQTLLSRVIHAATGDPYTHASIAFDAQLTTMCSFARLYSRCPLPAGLVHEHPAKGYFGRHPQTRYALYALDVPEAVYRRARGRAEAMLARQKATGGRAYRYSALGLLACRRGCAWEREDRMFCSQFVSRLLLESGAVRLSKAPSLMRPQELAALPGLRLCGQGRMGALAAACGGEPAAVREGKGELLFGIRQELTKGCRIVPACRRLIRRHIRMKRHKEDDSHGESYCSEPHFLSWQGRD